MQDKSLFALFLTLSLTLGCDGDKPKQPAVELKPEEVALSLEKETDQLVQQSNLELELFRSNDYEKNFYTAGFKKKFEQFDAQERRFLVPPSNFNYSIISKHNIQDGIEILINKKFKAVLPGADGVKERDTELNVKLLLKNNGQKWVIENRWESCQFCKEDEKCKQCGGTGKTMFPGGECIFCNGSGKCPECKGNRFVLKVPATNDFFKFVNNKRWIEDKSSPESVVKSFADARLRAVHQRSLLIKNYIENGVSIARKYFSAAIINEFEKSHREALNKANERGNEENTKLAEFRVRGINQDAKKIQIPILGINLAQALSAATDTVFALITIKDDFSQAEFKEFLELKKVGNEWLIDARLQVCTVCQGEGSDIACLGTGKTGSHPCPKCRGDKCSECKNTGLLLERECNNCNGSAKCPTCNGEGYLRPQE